MTAATPSRAGPDASGSRFDASGRWELHPSVSVRPEPFGALLYHFGTRRLTFLKDRRLLEVVTTLAEHGTPRRACAAAGVPAGEPPQFDAALRRLATISMLTPAENEVPDR